MAQDLAFAQSTTPASTTPLHEQVLDSWGLGIINGTYPPGSRIPTDDAVNGIAVSRTVTREVVRVLESMGLVTVRRKVGVVVAPAEAWNSFDPRIIDWRLRGPGRLTQLHALSELRSAIEPLAARLAARNGTPQHWGDLTRAVIGMSTNAHDADGDDYLAADALFHRTLLEASGNYMLASLSGVVVAVLEGRTKYALMPQTADPDAVRRHGDVAVAIQNGDEDAAEQAMRWIVTEADRAVQEMGS